MCAQGDKEEEDCLILNVFTPELPTDGNNPNIPVMFYIHGGSFSFGDTIVYSPFALLDRRVVLVVIQYRLGPLGWLSLDNDAIPGNAGLYDMIEALRWVNKHISAFGGDPNSVTIFGESAGGASIGHLLLCKQARGLFHRAIGQSGAATLPWAVDFNPVPHTLRIAELAGCPTEPEDALIECLRTSAPSVLNRAMSQHSNEERLNETAPTLGFGGSTPVVQHAGPDPLLVDDPRVLLQNGDYLTEIPIMFGSTKHEGSFALGALWKYHLTPLNKTDDYEFLKNDLVRSTLKILLYRDPTDEEVQTAIDYFLPGAEMGNFTSMMPGLVDLSGVLFIKAGGYELVKYHHKYNPASFLYTFDYEGRFSLMSTFLGDIPEIPHGVTHADELIYLFSLLPVVFNEEEESVTQRMVQIWTNFATYGHPTPDGVELLPGIDVMEPYTDELANYMYLDSEKFAARLNYTSTFTVARDENFGSQVLPDILGWLRTPRTR